MHNQTATNYVKMEKRAVPARPRRKPPMRWKLPVFLVIVAGAAAFITLNGWAKSQAKDAWGRLAAATAAAQSTGTRHAPAPPDPLPLTKRWDGYIHINERDSQSIGLAVVEV